MVLMKSDSFTAFIKFAVNIFELETTIKNIFSNINSGRSGDKLKGLIVAYCHLSMLFDTTIIKSRI